MGRIQVSPEQVSAAGGAVADVGNGLAGLAGSVNGVGGTASSPPATASALEELASQWTAGAERLREDLVAMGDMTQVAAVLYRTTDESSIVADW